MHVQHRSRSWRVSRTDHFAYATFAKLSLRLKACESLSTATLMVSHAYFAHRIYNLLVRDYTLYRERAYVAGHECMPEGP